MKYKERKSEDLPGRISFVSNKKYMGVLKNKLFTNSFLSVIFISSFFNLFSFLSAPGSYNVEKADKKIHGSSPAYSLGSKHKERKPEDMPGKGHNVKFRLTMYCFWEIINTDFTLCLSNKKPSKAYYY